MIESVMNYRLAGYIWGWLVGVDKAAVVEASRIKTL